MNKRNLGIALIALGASVWIPYFALKLSGAPVELAPFLLVHLSLVIPGAILAPSENIYSRTMRWIDRKRKDRRPPREETLGKEN